MKLFRENDKWSMTYRRQKVYDCDSWWSAIRMMIWWDLTGRKIKFKQRLRTVLGKYL